MDEGVPVLRGEQGAVRTQELDFLDKRMPKGGVLIMAMKKSVWDMILKLVIALVSAAAGVLGANAMPL